MNVPTNGAQAEAGHQEIEQGRVEDGGQALREEHAPRHEQRRENHRDPKHGRIYSWTSRSLHCLPSFPNHFPSPPAKDFAL